MKIQELKLVLKELAQKIRSLKIGTRIYQKEHGGCHGAIGFNMFAAQREYRHKHIAYCLLRGKTIEQIERTTRPDHKPDWCLIDAAQKQYQEVIETPIGAVHE